MNKIILVVSTTLLVVLISAVLFIRQRLPDERKHQNPVLRDKSLVHESGSNNEAIQASVLTSSKLSGASFNDLVGQLKNAKDESARNLILKEIVATYGPSPSMGSEVMDLLLSLPEKEASSHLVALARQNPPRDTSFYLDTLDKTGAGSKRNSLLQRGVQMFEISDLIALFEHLATDAYPEDYPALANSIKQGGLSLSINESDLSKLQSKIADPDVLQAIAHRLATRRAAADSGFPQEYKSLVAGIPEVQRKQYAETYYSHVLLSNADAPMSAIEKTAAPKEILYPIIADIARYRFGKEGGSKALQDSLEFSDRDLGLSYVGAVTRYWLRSDSLEATRTVSSMEGSEIRDAMISEVVGYCLERGDKSGAEQWIPQIGNPNLRSKFEKKPQPSH